MKMKWTLLIWAVSAVVAAMEVPLPFSSGFRQWRFLEGREFPGARGSIELENDSLRLNADFSGGGNYVGAARPIQADVSQVSFEVKTGARAIHLRFVDETKQTFQIGRRLSGNPEQWQQVSVPVAASKTFWGGARNGQWNAPLRELAIVVQKMQLSEPVAAVQIRNLSLRMENPAAVRYTAVQDDLSDNFVESGTRAPIRFRLVAPLTSPVAELLKYRITDYTGGLVQEGTAAYDPESGEVSIPAPAETGYYEISCPVIGEDPGSIVVDRRPAENPDPYFCMDAFFTSWGPPPQTPEQMKQHMRILRRNGIVWSRDRLHLAQISPRRGVVQLKDRADRYRRFGAEAGLRYLETFHQTPAWNRFPETPRTRNRHAPGTIPFAADLLAAGDQIVEIARQYREPIHAFESWNEPDNIFGHSLPPEYFASTVKMLSTALALRGFSLPVIGGSFANPLRGENYYRLCLENGLAEVSDAISFHNYTGVLRVLDYVDFMRREELRTVPERAGIPYWITECGRPWKFGTVRPPKQKSMECAANIVGKAVEFRALGAEKFFPFSYKYRFEQGANHGITDRYYRPLRQLAAYCHLIRELEHREYVGDLKINADRARVFSDGKNLVAAVYSGKGGRMTLPEELPVAAVRGIDGRRLTLTDRVLPLEEGLVYLELPLSAASAFLETRTRSMELYQLAKRFDRKPRSTKPLVIQSMHDVPLPYSQLGSTLSEPGRVKLELMINNFSDRPVAFEPVLELPEGVTVSGFDSRRRLVQGRTRLPFSFTLDFSSKAKPRVFHHIRLADRCGNADRTAYSIRIAGVGATLRLPHREWIAVSDWEPLLNGPAKAEISARFRLRHTREALHLTVEVEDQNHFCNYTLPESWKGDSLQIAVQGRSPGEKHGRKFSEYLLALCNGKSGIHTVSRQFAKQPVPEGSVQRRGRKTLYNLQIPAAVFGVASLEPGQVHGFSLLVNSSDGLIRDGFLAWGEGIGNGKFPGMYNQLKIE